MIHAKDVPATDPLASPELRAVIDNIIQANRRAPGAAMVVLNELQNEIGHVSPFMQAYVSEALKVPLSRIHGVVTFYSFFTTEPRGRHTLKLCLGTACYVGGTMQLLERARQALGIDVGRTTEDRAITLEVCRCVGACSQAPVVMVDEEIHGRVRPDKLPQLIRKYRGRSGQPDKTQEKNNGEDV